MPEKQKTPEQLDLNLVDQIPLALRWRGIPPSAQAVELVTKYIEPKSFASVFRDFVAAARLAEGRRRRRRGPTGGAQVLSEVRGCVLILAVAKRIESSAPWVAQGFLSVLDDRPKPQRTLLDRWRLFAFVLPGKVRRDVFEPAYNDMLQDYLRARLEKNCPAWWLNIAFTIRTIHMVAQCIRAMTGAWMWRIVLAAWPSAKALQWLKWWWGSKS